MKNSMKTLAMLSLSACVLVGGAVSSFAAEPSTAQVVTHKACVCNDYSSTKCSASNCKADVTDNMGIVAQFQNADGTTKTYNICSGCGKVNGKSTLTKVSDAFANFSGLTVYKGTLDNGETVMTITCLGGAGAITDVSANVELPAEAVEGYDLYLVNEDGTETKLDVSIGRKAYVKVNMQNGAALIHMVAQTNS